MYNITKTEQMTLLRIDATDDIQRLQPVLGDLTVAVLRSSGTETIEDLIKLEPIKFANLDDISEAEREKLEAVYYYLFHAAYEDLHG